MDTDIKLIAREPKVPDRDQTLSQLVKTISEIKGFSLHFALCDAAEERKNLQQSIIDSLSPNMSVETVAIIHPIKSLYHYLQRNLSGASLEVLFITGIEQWLETDEAGENSVFVANLNQHRNSFSKSIKCPLILWTTSSVMRTIALGASDFFSIRSDLFVFNSPANMNQNKKSNSNLGSHYNALLSLTLEERKGWLDHVFDRIKRLSAQEKNQQNDLDLASALTTQGYLLTILGHYNDALNTFTQALAIYENVFGAEHTNTANSLNNLGYLHRVLGNYDKALLLYERALAIHEKVLGAEHPDTAGSINNLGNLHEILGNYDKSIYLYKRALAIREKIFGSDNVNTATSLNNLANLHNTLGSYDKALPLYIRALEIREKVLGEQHSDTANSLNDLGYLYKTQGNYKKALFLYERALAINEKVLGAEHPDTANSLNNLAVLFSNQQKFKDACTYIKRACKIYVKILGAEHLSTKQSFESLEAIEEALRSSTR